MPTKFASLLLSFFILFQSFNVHLLDVLKLQSLLQHIEFHESTYGDDIFSFLAKHYGDKMTEHREQNNGEGDHQKLPFNHSVCMDAGQLFILESFAAKLVLSDPPIVKKRTFHYYNFYSYLENTDIFQPPKIA